MSYNTELWNKYTDDNNSELGEDISKFIYFLTLSLGAKSTLEAGCNVGNNLKSFPSSYNVFGVDLNEHALEKGRKKYPNFEFRKGSLLELPFNDSEVDLVFTRGVLIHIRPDDVKQAMSELVRVSKLWIFNMEYFGEDEKEIDWKRGSDLLWYRNMKKRWMDFDVDIISDVEIPLKVDPGKVRLTIVKKRT